MSYKSRSQYLIGKCFKSKKDRMCKYCNERGTCETREGEKDKRSKR